VSAAQHRRHPAGLRRLLPVRRPRSAADVTVVVDVDDSAEFTAREPGPVDFHASQPLASLREALTGAPLEPLPLPARAPVPAGLRRPPPVLTPGELANLEKVAGRLRAFGGPEPDGSGGGEPGPDRDYLPPSAFLRAVIHDRPELTEPIGCTPEFAGTDAMPDGTRVAGMFLGTNEDGCFVIDSTDPAWCEDLITAATAMRDALVSGSLRPVPAWADEGGAA